MSTFPTVPLGYRLEVAPGADPTDDPDDVDWTDVTTDIAAGIPIIHKCGSDDEQGDSSSESEFVFRNPDRRWSTDNPLSDMWPGWDVDCPIRCSLSLDGSSTWIEWWTQYASEITDIWGGTSGRLPRTAVRADGLLRRLGAAGLQMPALTRSQLAGSPIAAWPVDDEYSATQAASAVTGGAPMVATGSVSFGSLAGAVGSKGLVASLTGGGKLTGAVAGCNSTGWRVEWVTNTSALEGCFPIELRTNSTSGVTWRFIPPNALDPTAYVQARLVDTTLACNVFFAMAVADYASVDCHWALVAEQSGTKIKGTLYLNGVLVAAATSVPDYNLGACTFVVGNSQFTGISIVGGVYGIAVYNSTAAPTSYAALDGYADEMAHIRVARVLAELGIPSDVTATVSTQLGPQQPGTPLDILRAAEDADHGQLDDSRGRVAYRALSEICNQTANLTIDADEYELGFPLRPVTDDQKLVNKSTVERIGGSSATIDRTNGAAERVRDARLNLANDDQPIQHASWYVSVGSVRGKRVPQISINFAAAPQLAAAFLALRLGDRVTIVNAPQHLAASGTLDLVWVGWSSATYSRRAFWATANCTSYEPYRVGVYGTDPGGIVSRYDSGSSTLSTGYSASATSLVVNIAAGGAPWVRSAVKPTRFPMDVEIEGMVYSCTAISGTGPQTFTVVRLGAAADKPLNSGATVRPYRPARSALGSG